MKTHKWTVQTEDGIVSVEYSRRWNDTEYALLVNGKQHHMQSREAIYIVSTAQIAFWDIGNKSPKERAKEA